MGLSAHFRIVLAGLVVLVLAASPGAQARELGGVGDLTGIDLTRGLHFAPSAQLDDPMSFLPKGDLASDAWDWPIVIGQYLSSAALSVGGAVLFNRLSTSPSGATQDTVKRDLITYGLLQFLTVPLASATGVYLVGSADEYHDVGYAWPLLANYAAELILIAVRIGINVGGLKGGDAAGVAGDVLGKFAPIDYVLHAIVVPVTVTYFSLRSRGPKGMSLVGERETAPVPMAVLPAVRSVASVREASAMAPTGPLAVQLPLAALRF